ncbi:MAG: hypothetical protein Q9M28_09935 [Mariprofundaceae bacterium]|nr:hypothetical protein [Mariprofundaceae bacterium]
MTRINTLYGMTLMILLPINAMALDLDKLETTVSSQLCQNGDCKSNCDDALVKRIGQDLPSDADSCHAKEQYRLLAKGLYRTTKGETKSLKQEFTPVVSQDKMNLPDIQAQPVTDKPSPYIIDLQEKAQSKSTSKEKEIEVKPVETVLTK